MAETSRILKEDAAEESWPAILSLAIFASVMVVGFIAVFGWKRPLRITSSLDAGCDQTEELGKPKGIASKSETSSV
jgi:hypothetical protein